MTEEVIAIPVAEQPIQVELVETEEQKKDKKLDKMGAADDAYYAADTYYIDNEGIQEVVIFPNGIKNFAAKHAAEVIYLEESTVKYYSNGKWIELGEGDNAPSTLVSLHKPQK